MGYYTKYSLNITPCPSKEEEMEITLEIANCFGCKEEVKINDYWEDWLEEEMKWYDHEDDMKKISKKFPKFLFQLDGEGEENGDIWTKFFKNGKVQTERAEIVKGNFDASKLK